jgi:hypothetical protein
MAIRTARALHLPIEPGVSETRDKLILWAHLLDDVIPSWSDPIPAAPSPGGAVWRRTRPSGCEDSGGRYDPSKGQGRNVLGATAEGPGPRPPRGAAPGRISSAAPSTFLLTPVGGPPTSPTVHQMFLSFSKGSEPSWYLLGSVGRWPTAPLSAPTNHRAGHRPRGPSCPATAAPVPVMAPSEVDVGSGGGLPARRPGT